MTAELHTCSYYCERPECVRRQRDELRDLMESALASAPPSAPVGVDFAAVAAILRRAMRDGVHYGYRRDFILQQALALEALSQQPAAVDAGRAQRIQALVGGVEVDLEAPLSAGANATAQTHGAMLRQLEPQLQEQLEEYEYTIAAQEAEIERLRAEVERLRTDLMESDEIREKLGHLLTRTAAALKGEPPAGVWHSWHDLPERAERLAKALKELITWIPSADTYRRLGFDPESPMRALRRARAAVLWREE